MSLSMAQTGEVLQCNLTAYTYNTTLQILVDYYDGYTSIFSLNEQTILLNKTYSISGYYYILTTVLNQDILVNQTILVVGEPTCSKPVINIPNKGTKQNPTKYFRSNMLTVVGLTAFECGLRFNYTKTWVVELVDNTTNRNAIRNISLVNNPTARQAEIVFSQNTLDYGVYKFFYEVGIYFILKNRLVPMMSSVYTYLSINPTGLKVRGFANGLTQTAFGSSQTTDLNPGLYTIDLDSFVNPANFQFRIYCRVILKTTIFDSSFTDTEKATATPINNLYLISNDYGKCLEDDS